MLRPAGQSLGPSVVPPIQEACLAPPYVFSNTCVPQQCLFSAHSCIMQKCGEASAKGLLNRGWARTGAGVVHYVTVARLNQESSVLGSMPSPGNPYPQQPLRAVWVPGKSCPSFIKCPS